MVAFVIMPWFIDFYFFTGVLICCGLWERNKRSSGKLMAGSTVFQ